MSTTSIQRGVIVDGFARTALSNLVAVVAGAAFIGLAAQISIPLSWTPVPLTGQTFAVLLVGAAAGLRRAVAATLLYAVLGLVGVPWFAGHSSGFVTVTFGYIIGFVAAAALVGWLAERGWTRRPWLTFAAMLLGDLVIYAIGVPWLKAALGVSWGTAFTLGMTPFLLGDLVKAALATGVFAAAWPLFGRSR